ncbi:ABC transporter ATP-binding protein [Alkalihalobacillus sp. AL-G]|uniref:ABC transporter ATP-binding protein n=1 Tax=Alkalihalobacillus sp. AL-G TaxID=2926399 RepID=UPI00272A3B8F|nr:ABC transporter ATP-binding protein [Alkalihalobacillus sp. AL-G]WLD92024.1 ABC transporter ATP-binding protein [Alkalihalobacillus sp. AL-G]
MDTLLEVQNLNVEFKTDKSTVHALRGINLTVKNMEVVAIVGESGSGKSVTAKSIMRLLPPQTATFKSGRINFENKDLTKMSKKEIAEYRGSKISMVFQDPMTSLNPTMKIGEQIAEGLIIHSKLSKKMAMNKAAEMVSLVGIPDAVLCCKKYPHQLSGGMRQRVGIAMALVCHPKLLIADEPTTALDVTIQAQIIDLLKEVQKKLGMSVILITHDLGLVANMADRILVMYAGNIVESGTIQEIFYNPKHPYTWGLLKSVPKLSGDRNEELNSIPGAPPDLSEKITGCPFSTRCPYVMDVCEEYSPIATELSGTHSASCWLLDRRAPELTELVES